MAISQSCNNMIQLLVSCIRVKTGIVVSVLHDHYKVSYVLLFSELVKHNKIKEIVQS